MKQGTFEKEIFIHSTPEKALELLSDFSRHHRIHPLIQKVELAENPPAGVMKRYFITDQLQWGMFHFKIRYRADILSVSADMIRSEAYQSPGTYVSNVTTVRGGDGGVILHECITIKAPDMLFGYTFGQAQAAHEKMLERIKVYLES